MKKKILLFFLIFIFGINNVKALDANDVAEIDGSYYKSLSAAINAAPENTNTTIKLLKDRNENITISNKKDIVLDLNGFTLGNNGSNSTVINNNGKLEIKNGTVTTNATSGMINNNSGATLVLNGGNYIATESRQVLYNKAGTATITGNAYLESNTSVRATVHNLNSGIINIDSGTIIANNSYAVYNDKGTLNIGTYNDVYDKTSPVIQGKTYGVIANDSINIYDGIIKGVTYHIGMANSSSEPTTEDDIGETKVNGIEDFSEKEFDEEQIGDDLYKTFTYDLDSSSIINITFNPNGGTVNPETKKIIIGNPIGELPIPRLIDNKFDGWFTSSTGGTKIDGSEMPSSNVTYYAHWTYDDPNTAAYVEGEGLMSLEAAFAIGGKIRLEKDVIIDEDLFMNKEATLDLNGNTITLDNKTIFINEEVTITDLTAAGDGKITSNSEFAVVVGKPNTATNGHLIHEGGIIEGLGSYGAVRNYETLEVNGGTLLGTATTNRGFVVYNEKTAIMNSGTIYSTNGRAVQVYTNSTFTMNGGLVKTDAENDQSVSLYGDCSATINGGVIEGLGYNSAGIAVFHNTNLTVNGGTITGHSMAVAGNGNETNTNANITVNGGDLTAVDGVGIYLPQRESTTIINSGNISGLTGIEIRAGELIINDGSIVGTASEYKVTTNDNGTSIEGVAVGISQHTSKQPINVVINGGSFESVVGLCIVNPLNNPASATELITVDINDGYFVSNGAETIVRDSTIPNTPFISGGTYTTDPEIFAEDGYVSVLKSDGRYRIEKLYNIVMDSTSASIVSTDKTRYLPNEIVELKINEKRINDLIIEVKDAVGTPIELKNNKFIMPATDVIITARYKEIINPNTGDNILSYVLLLEISIIGLLSIKVYNIKRKDIF